MDTSNFPPFSPIPTDTVSSARSVYPSGTVVDSNSCVVVAESDYYQEKQIQRLLSPPQIHEAYLNIDADIGPDDGDSSGLQTPRSTPGSSAPGSGAATPKSGPGAASPKADFGAALTERLAEAGLVDDSDMGEEPKTPQRGPAGRTPPQRDGNTRGLVDAALAEAARMEEEERAIEEGGRRGAEARRERRGRGEESVGEVKSGAGRDGEEQGRTGENASSVGGSERTRLFGDLHAIPVEEGMLDTELVRRVVRSAPNVSRHAAPTTPGDGRPASRDRARVTNGKFTRALKLAKKAAVDLFPECIGGPLPGLASSAASPRARYGPGISVPGPYLARGLAAVLARPTVFARLVRVWANEMAVGGHVFSVNDAQSGRRARF